MRIVHLISGGDVGGAKTYLLCLLPNLAKFHDITLAALKDGPLAREAVKAGIKVRVAPDSNPRSAALSIRDLVENADIVHCHGARANVTGVFVKKLTKGKVITTVHSDYRVDYTGTPLKWLTFGMANRLALRYMDYFIGVSGDIADQLIRRRFAPERIMHVYNGIDLSVKVQRLSEDERAAYLTSIGLNYRKGDVVCGIAARLTRSKDLPTLLTAFKMAVQTNDRLKLIIAGRGECENTVKRHADELGLSERVCFPGWLKTMPEFFGSIDINILSSRGGEGLAYSVLEAARAKVVNISSRDGGLPALIDSGENGALFGIGDRRALAEHISALSLDADLRARFADRLYEKLSRGFSLDVMVNQYLNIYQRVARPAQPKSLTLCGAYGMGNSGDDAILRSILREINEIEPSATIRVMTRTPVKTRLMHHVRTLYTFNPISLTRTFMKSDIYVSGGGNLIQNVTSSRSLWFYLFTLWWARVCGAKVVMYGCGVGPVNGRLNRRLAGRTIDNNVSAITLREDGSFDELKRLGVTKPEISLTADPAIMLEPAPEAAVRSFMRDAGIDPDGRYICFSLRAWKKASLAPFAEAAQYAYEKYGLTPVFLQISHKKDNKSVAKVTKMLRCPYFVLGETPDPLMSIGVLAHMSALVAIRLHALIFAVGRGVPCVGVSYDDKVASFLRYAGGFPCVMLDKLTPEWLCARIDEAVSGPHKASGLEALREREAGNKETLKRMMSL